MGRVVVVTAVDGAEGSEGREWRKGGEPLDMVVGGW